MHAAAFAGRHPGHYKRHALLAAGGEEAAEAGFGDHLARGRDDRRVVAGRQAAGLLQLAAVGRDPAAAAVAPEVAPLWVDPPRRSQERRVRTECVRTCRSRWET